MQSFHHQELLKFAMESTSSWHGRACASRGTTICSRSSRIRMCCLPNHLYVSVPGSGMKGFLSYRETSWWIAFKSLRQRREYISPLNPWFVSFISWRIELLKSTSLSHAVWCHMFQKLRDFPSISRLRLSMPRMGHNNNSRDPFPAGLGPLCLYLCCRLQARK